MYTKFIVSAIGLVGFLTASAAGTLDCDSYDMHWRDRDHVMAGGTQNENCGTQCDDMHW
jgi:hypothetical protein